MASTYLPRMRATQKKYREKRKKKDERNAAILHYVTKHFPWVIEAFKIKTSTEKVIKTFNISFLYDAYKMSFLVER